MIATFTVPPPPMRDRVVAVAIVLPAPPPAKVLDELPEGVWDRGGQLFYECRSCGRDFPLECEPEEFVPEFAYCGGSPRCLP